MISFSRLTKVGTPNIAPPSVSSLLCLTPAPPRADAVRHPACVCRRRTNPSRTPTEPGRQRPATLSSGFRPLFPLRPPTDFRRWLPEFFLDATCTLLCLKVYSSVDDRFRLGFRSTTSYPNHLLPPNAIRFLPPLNRFHPASTFPEVRRLDRVPFARELDLTPEEWE